MRTGDRRVTVYFAWITSAVNAKALDSRRMRPKVRGQIRSGFERLVLRRLVVLLLDGGRFTTLDQITMTRGRRTWSLGALETR